MAKDTMKRIGVEVDAADETDALGKFVSHIPDVVLVAENEPATIIKTVREMRAEEGGNAPKIVVMMRLDGLEYEQDILKAGANECGTGFNQEDIKRIFD